MGSLRFILALFVVLGHLDISLPNLNVGMFALPCFYIVSGYAMTAVIRVHYDTSGKIKWFYLDRVLRLYPQYMLFLTLTTILISSLGLRHAYFANLAPQSVHVPLFDFLLNVLMLPNNLLAFRAHFSEIALIIPPAWSLGLELSFYLIFPWILLRRLRGVTLVGSIIVFALALFTVINPMTWGYSLLPGTLFFFLMGSFMYDLPEEKAIVVPMASGLLGGVLLAVLLATGLHERGANLPLVAAVIAGPALVFMVRKLRHRMDDFLGNISYGIFLVHFVLIQVLTQNFPQLPFVTTATLVITGSIGCAIVGYLAVEKPALVFRRRFRKSVGPTVTAKRVVDPDSGRPSGSTSG